MLISDLCPTPKALAGQHRIENGANIRSRFPEQGEARVDDLVAIMTEACAKAGGVDLNPDEMPRPTKRLLAGLAENVLAHHDAAISRGHASALLRGSQSVLERAGLSRMSRSLHETTNSADIAAFTTQQLAYLVDVFAPFIAPEFFTTIVMTGPRAFVHRQNLMREDAGVYAADSALVDGLDPSYSDCPTECSEANGIDVEITSELIEADCKRLTGRYCLPANWHASSQYGVSLDRVLQEGMGIELRRSIQADLMNLLVANAGGTRTWNATAPAAGYFSTAAPKEWRRELWRNVKIANRAILSAAEGRVSATHVIGDVTSIGYFEDAMDVQFVDQQPGNVVLGTGDETTDFLGVTKVGRWNVFRMLEGLAANTILVMNRDDRNPTAIYAPWIPITALEPLADPSLADVRLGAITLFGSVVTQSDRVQEIVIGP